MAQISHKSPTLEFNVSVSDSITLTENSPLALSAGTLFVNKSDPVTTQDLSITGENFGSSLSFDGVDDMVTLDNSTALGDVFTITAWVNVRDFSTSNTAYPIYAQIGTTVDHVKNYLHIQPSTRKLLFDQFTPAGGSVSSTNTIDAGKWYFVTVSQSAANARIIYINGENEGNSTEQYNGSGVGAIRIGRRTHTSSGSHDFKGLIDDVRLYDGVALTQEQIRSIYYGETVSGLIHRYKFDEGSGTTALDSAGSSNGTISGAVYSTDVPTRSINVVLIHNVAVSDSITLTENRALSLSAGTLFVNKNESIGVMDHSLGGRTFGTSLFFSGSTWVFVGGNTNQKTSVFSVSAWIKPTSITAASPRTIRGGASGAFPQFRLETDGKLGLIKQGVLNIASSTGKVVANKWQQVGVTYDASGNWTFYFNGVQDSTGTNLQGFTFGDTDFGRQQVGEFFIGGIDEIQIGSTAVSSATMGELYSNVIATLPSLQGWYKFNEGSGAVAIDSSSNAYNGDVGSATYSTDAPANSIQLQALLAVTVSESITVTESATILQVGLISKSESITVTESTSLSSAITISKSDSITLTESISVAVVGHQINLLEAISVHDYYSSINFNGTTNHVSWGNILLTSSVITVAFWLQPLSTPSSNHEVVFGYGNSRWFFIFNGASTGIRFTVKLGGIEKSTANSTAIGTTTPKLIVGTYDPLGGANNLTLRIYNQNGTLFQSLAATWTGDIDTTTAPLTMGYDPIRGFYVDMYGDSAMIFSRVLSTGEQDALALDQSVSTANLDLWARFDEGAGTVAADSSGNGRNGTLQSAGMWRTESLYLPNAVNLLQSLTVTVSDSITITESRLASISSSTALNITISESIAVSENLGYILIIFIIAGRRKGVVIV